MSDAQTPRPAGSQDVVPPPVAAYDAWAEYYDLTDADREPFVTFYGSLLSPDIRSVLELGCGTGTIAIALAARLRARPQSSAARVVGVDLSQGMLSVARRRDQRVEWLHGDMRAPDVRGPFDVVLCCFNTLQHLLTDADMAAALSAVRRLLGPRGVFAFDVYQPNAEYLNAPHTNHLARTVAGPDGAPLEIREDTGYDPLTCILTVTWRLVDPRRPDAEPLAQSQYGLRQYSRLALDRLIEAAGLTVRERYGEFDRAPFTARSRKQILLCTANASR
jgi:SAM-dependent methyltransferase